MTDQLHRWRILGWENPFWEYVRYFCSLRGRNQKQFREELQDNFASSEIMSVLGISSTVKSEMLDYLKYRDAKLANVMVNLRTESDSLSFWKAKQIKWKITKTKSEDHHQSSGSVVATVSHIANEVCIKFGIGLEANPQKRCVWNLKNYLHVSSRNLDGAISGLENPFVVWEIKEYWGKTKGGSKMSDAVYECQLVGKEIRGYEKLVGEKIHHLVFLDGKEQWSARKSDMARFIDLESQGLIDHLFVGHEIEDIASVVLEKIVGVERRN